MTFMALPILFVGLPLLFRSSAGSEGVKLGFRRGPLLHLKRKRLALLLFSTQGLGVIFVIVFSLAYYIPIPSTQVLIGEPIFHSLLQIFGGFFFVFTILVLILSAIVKKVDKGDLLAEICLAEPPR